MTRCPNDDLEIDYCHSIIDGNYRKLHFGSNSDISYVSITEVIETGGNLSVVSLLYLYLHAFVVKAFRPEILHQ